MSIDQHKTDGERFSILDFLDVLRLCAFGGLVFFFVAEILRGIWNPLGLVCYGGAFGLAEEKN